MKKENTNATYTIEIKCDNCGHEGYKKVEKGITAAGTHICPYCGCKSGRSQGRPPETIRL